MRLPRRPARIDHHDPPRLPLRNRQISFAHAPKERPRLLLEAVLVVCPRLAAFELRLFRRRARLTLAAASESSRIVKSGCRFPHSTRCNSRTASLPSRRPLPWYASVESVNRSHSTMLPCASAGSITSAICCAREANISAISASGASPAVPESSSTLRIFSPVSVPPGSRVSTDLVPRRAQHRRQLPHLRALAGSVEPFEGDEFPAPRHSAE